MTARSKPLRSLLYIPGSRERALEKAAGLPTDGIIFDLEDAVAPDDKARARALVAETLTGRDYGRRSLMVRINGFDSPWWEPDLEAVCAAAPEAILLPKVNGPADIARLAAWLDRHPACADTAIWAMMETPAGVLAADAVAAAERMHGMVLGTNDLAKDLRLRGGDERAALTTSLSLCLLAARARGLICIDGVYNRYQDTEGLRAECEQGRALGMDGKSLIHPAQIAVANDVFAPSAEEVALAERRIDAFAEAEAKGQGIAVLDGQIVENLHVEAARALLAQVAMIREMEAG